MASALDLLVTRSSAALASRTPQPSFGVQPVPLGLDALCSSTFATWTFVSVGFVAQTRAATPATSGAEKLVPFA